MNKYVVEMNRQVMADFTIIYYIKRVCSYKKGAKGMLTTIDIDKAHKYGTEKTALKPAQFYGGLVKMV